MFDSMKEKRALMTTILAWGIIPLVYLSWCLFTLGYKGLLFQGLGVIVSIFAVGLYAYCFIYSNAYDLRIKNQVRNISLVGTIVSLVAIIACLKGEKGSSRLFIVISLLGWLLAFVINILKTEVNQNNRCVIIDYIKRYFALILLCILVVALSFDSNMFQLKWDGLLYYTAVKSAKLSSLSSLALYGHVSQTPGFVYCMLGLLLGNVNVGMQMANIGVLVLGIIAFYCALKVVVPGKRECFYILGTSCFAFSPFLLGMVNYYSTDYYCVCLAPILIYTLVSERYVEMVPAACLFCFTKEPAIIAYAMICLGIVIVDFIETESGPGAKVKHILSSAKYYFLLIPLILWYVTYKCLGQWSAGDGGFEVDSQYIVDKLKVFVTFNFNWVITTILLVSVIGMISRGLFIKVRKWYIPLLISNIGLLVFNISFATVNHARYIDSFISINIFLAVAGILVLLKDYRHVVCALLLSLVVIINAISCYVSFDPVSNELFKSEKLGTARIYSTGEDMLGDASIYNKQMLWLENNINKAVSDALEENTDIAFVVPDHSVYGLVGMSEMIFMSENIQKDILYWDLDKNKRVSYAEQQDDAQVPILLISSEETIDADVFEKDKVSIIRIGAINCKEQGFASCETKEYEYRGWTIYRDILVK